MSKAQVASGRATVKALGFLREPRWRHHRQAFAEVLLNILISAAPFWLGALVLCLDRGIYYVEGFSRINQYGELYIYAAATIAPVLYLILKERGSNRFRGKILLGASFFVCASVATVIFTWERVTEMALPTAFLSLSVPVFAIAVVTLYFATAFDNAVPDASTAMREQEDSFVQRLKSHRAGKR